MTARELLDKLSELKIDLDVPVYVYGDMAELRNVEVYDDEDGTFVSLEG